MSNEEMLEEILIKAHKLGIHQEVLIMSNELSGKYDMITSCILSIEKLTSGLVV